MFDFREGVRQVGREVDVVARHLGKNEKTFFLYQLALAGRAWNKVGSQVRWESA